MKIKPSCMINDYLKANCDSDCTTELSMLDADTMDNYHYPFEDGDTRLTALQAKKEMTDLSKALDKLISISSNLSPTSIPVMNSSWAQTSWLAENIKNMELLSEKVKEASLSSNKEIEKKGWAKGKGKNVDFAAKMVTKELVGIIHKYTGKYPPSTEPTNRDGLINSDFHKLLDSILKYYGRNSADVWHLTREAVNGFNAREKAIKSIRTKKTD